ncbi:MAG: hypothetical protein OEV61_09235 [Chloroflexota bacterium]|nr:hypothetical protein [Chloroflexota bacterium]MDH5244502.1 hypothetical protein [Chloroflexota bacterium]
MSRDLVSIALEVGDLRGKLYRVAGTDGPMSEEAPPHGRHPDRIRHESDAERSEVYAIAVGVARQGGESGSQGSDLTP